MADCPQAEYPVIFHVMARMQPARHIAVIAIIAMILGIFLPFVSVSQMSDPQRPDIATLHGAMNCDSCSKADMMLTGCTQMSCQIATLAGDCPQLCPTGAIRYVPVV